MPAVDAAKVCRERRPPAEPGKAPAVNGPQCPPLFRTCPEILALAARPDEFEIIAGLREIAGRYGEVRAVTSLAGLAQAAEGVATFLVDFATTSAALLAARELDCPLFGYHTLIVSIPRPGGGRE